MMTMMMMMIIIIILPGVLVVSIVRSFVGKHLKGWPNLQTCKVGKGISWTGNIT